MRVYFLIVVLIICLLNLTPTYCDKYDNLLNYVMDVQPTCSLTNQYREIRCRNICKDFDCNTGYCIDDKICRCINCIGKINQKS